MGKRRELGQVKTISSWQARDIHYIGGLVKGLVDVLYVTLLGTCWEPYKSLHINELEIVTVLSKSTPPLSGTDQGLHSQSRELLLVAAPWSKHSPTTHGHCFHQQAWGTIRLPLLCLIHKVLLKLERSRERLLIAPRWARRPWFPLLRWASHRSNRSTYTLK